MEGDGEEHSRTRGTPLPWDRRRSVVAISKVMSMSPGFHSALVSFPQDPQLLLCAIKAGLRDGPNVAKMAGVARL